LKERGVKLFIMKEMNELVEFLSQQQKVAQQLEAACKSNDIDKLEGALQQVENLNVKVTLIVLLLLTNPDFEQGIRSIGTDLSLSKVAL